MRLASRVGTGHLRNFLTPYLAGDFTAIMMDSRTQAAYITKQSRTPLAPLGTRKRSSDEDTMSEPPKSPLWLSRREFAQLGVGTLALGLGARTVRAQQELAPAETGWERHINSITGGKEPIEDNVTLELPEVAENGNLVPFTVAVDYEMSNTDYIQSLHVIATANPAPGIISFYFTPLSGVARASSRMRLADTQDIVALAQTSGGEFFVGRRRVEVVVPCCGG